MCCDQFKKSYLNCPTLTGKERSIKKNKWSHVNVTDAKSQRMNYFNDGDLSSTYIHWNFSSLNLVGIMWLTAKNVIKSTCLDA